MSKYAEAVDAESRYQEELERVYGKDAGTARYDHERNAATPRLKLLRAVRDEAVGAWNGLMQEHRRES